MHESDGLSFHSNYLGMHGMVLFSSDSLQLLSYLSSVCSRALSRLLWPVRLKMDGLWETYIT